MNTIDFREIIEDDCASIQKDLTRLRHRTVNGKYAEAARFALSIAVTAKTVAAHLDLRAAEIAGKIITEE